MDKKKLSWTERFVEVFASIFVYSYLSLIVFCFVFGLGVFTVEHCKSISRLATWNRVDGELPIEESIANFAEEEGVG